MTTWSYPRLEHNTNNLPLSWKWQVKVKTSIKGNHLGTKEKKIKWTALCDFVLLYVMVTLTANTRIRRVKNVLEPTFFSLHGRQHVGSRTTIRVESETNALPLFLDSRKLPSTVLGFPTDSPD
jgi:hypothetical protein